MKKDLKVAIEDGPDAYTVINGIQKPVITTKGRFFQMRWKDGYVNWSPLATIKSSNPDELTEYAESKCFAKEPASRWWVKGTPRKRSNIINKVQRISWVR